jgi:hypothetical protein
MKNKLTLCLATFSVLILAGCGQSNSNSGVKGIEPAKDDAKIIFFYGRECPHCQLVEKYFTDNKIAEKITFSQREIYHDKGNAALMVSRAASCGIEEKDLGVPMLWAEGKCLFGEKDIEQFFENKINGNK